MIVYPGVAEEDAEVVLMRQVVVGSGIVEKNAEILFVLDFRAVENKAEIRVAARFFNFLL